MLDNKDWASGYDWVCNTLEDRHEELAIQMKLEQAAQRLKRKDFGVAIRMLKTLQKKDKEVKAATATNLSVVSFLEGNIEQASEYAEVALDSDRYNAKALVNKGNFLLPMAILTPQNICILKRLVSRLITSRLSSTLVWQRKQSTYLKTSID